MKPALSGILLLVVPGTGAEAPRPPEETGFVGLLVQDHAPTGGCLVGWVLPGPLQGTGFQSPHVNRGDIILSVNGKPVGREAFYQLVERSRPGQEWVLKVLRTGGPTDAAVPREGVQRQVHEVRVTLAAKADWSGPISFVHSAASPPDPDAVLGLDRGPTALETFLDRHIAAFQLREPIDRLLAYFRKTQDRNTGFHTLSRVVAGFHRPTRLPELQQRVTGPLADLGRDPRLVLVQAAQNLDAKAPALGEPAPLADPPAALDWMSRRLAAAHGHLNRAFARFPPERRGTWAADLALLTDRLAEIKYVMGHPEPARLIRAMRDSMAVDYVALVAAAAELAGLLGPAAAPPPRTAAVVPIPAALGQAVEGPILGALYRDGRWCVYGGFGPNRYDMSKLDAVIDPGGHDVYVYPRGPRPSVQVVYDWAGDDRHAGSNGPGPASALMGVSLLVDLQGNDRYEGQTRSCGAGLAGVAVLLDRDGADVYAGTSWSLGAGFYGIGAILDLGSGSDTYLAHIFSEGVGGPRGFGLILDQGGQDLYRANGPVPSAYGLPAVYCAFSQGVGFGVRHYDSGGVGVLADLAGNDRYEAGEFSQGGAYSWGLGILYDRSGNDLYYGQRYSQGYGCHQGIGILADDAGDDTYWAMTAANQGGAWDIALGLLIDRAGHDSYQADGLAQGGAAMQAMAWLIDLEGTDRYVAGAHACHGQSWNNQYHYAESGCFSWSLLLDAGGTTDYYSSGRPNGQALAPGQADPKDPQNHHWHGLFIDTAERVRF